MGMVLYINGLDRAHATELENDEEALMAAIFGDDAWEADKMWWAALDLLFGPNGINRLDGAPVTEEGGYSPIMKMSADALAAIVNDLSTTYLQQIEQRFANEAFGEPLGPEVVPDDREWLCNSANELAELLRQAHRNGEAIYWVVA
jgi:Domain of unknown function (DUF1877)